MILHRLGIYVTAEQLAGPVSDTSIFDGVRTLGDELAAVLEQLGVDMDFACPANRVQWETALRCQVPLWVSSDSWWDVEDLANVLETAGVAYEYVAEVDDEPTNDRRLFHPEFGVIVPQLDNGVVPVDGLVKLLSERFGMAVFSVDDVVGVVSEMNGGDARRKLDEIAANGGER